MSAAAETPASPAAPWPTAAAIADGPCWGLVRLTVPKDGRAVGRNLDPAAARRLAIGLLTAADEADEQRAAVRAAQAGAQHAAATPSELEP